MSHYIRSLTLFLALSFIYSIAWTQIAPTAQEGTKTSADRAALLQMAEKFERRQRADSVKIEELKARFGESVIMQVGDDGKITRLVRFDDLGFPEFYETHNANAAITTSTSSLYAGGGAGYSLSGNGIELGEWDGGAVRATHQELTGRVTQVDNPSSNSDHATHVAGTMLASGVSSSAKGMAFQATLKAHDFSNDESEMATYAAGSNSILSNHSYGTITGWYYNSGEDAWYWYGTPSVSATEDYYFGFYNYWAYVWDTIANAAPNYLIVKSAGNDRNDNISAAANDTHYVWSGGWTLSTATRAADCAGGFDCISTSGNAKNILTVGAVGDISSGYSAPNDVAMSSFSGWGPTDDGRIKPDIVGNGVSLYSSGSASNSDYYFSSGTSMSAPNVTGSLALIQEFYEDQNNAFMLSSALKALIIQTANEAGAADGPDYKFGWGLLDTRAAVEHLDDTNSILTWSDLNNNDSLVYNYYFDGTEPLVATICWNDPAGTPTTAQLDPTTSMLVNDLDLRVRNDSSGIVYQPWILNPASPNSAATTGDNFRDNIEQVEIDAPDPGYYTFTIKHKGTLANAQQVSIAISRKADPPAICINTSSTLNETICQGQTYTSPASNSYTTTGTYVETIPNSAGCDSVITINLTVSNPSLNLNTSGGGCGNQTGTISAGVSGAVAPYSWIWNTGATTPNLGGLSNGTYTVTVTDAAGCTAEESATVNNTVDNTAPIAVTQNVTINLNAFGVANLTANMVDNGSSDNCSISSLSISQILFDCDDIGNNVVTLTATDPSGNSGSAPATITVVDNLDPTVVVQNISVNLNASGAATITAAMVDNGSSDNCNVASMSIDQSNFNCNDIGANTVTLTVTDGSGNVASESATITVIDNIVPNAVALGTTVYLNASGTFTLSATAVDNGSTDNCAITNLAVSPNSFTCNDLGANSVLFGASDASGNTGTATVTVNVLDTLSPQVGTQNISVNLDAAGLASITATQVNNGSTDNCGISTMSLDVTNFDCSDIGANTVTLTVTDASGNSKSATSIVTVVDNQAPQLVSQNASVQLGANGTISITGAMFDNGSTDNCGIDFFSATPNVLNCSHLGTTTVLFSATDASGNVSSTNVTVDVFDTISPVAVAQNMSLSIGANGQVTLNPATFGAGSSDNCQIDNMSVSPSTFDCNDIGTPIQVTLTVSDASGNTSQAVGMLTLTDDIDPVVVAQSTTVYLDQNGMAGMNASMITDTVYDNCDLTQVYVSPASFNCNHVGTANVTLFANDASGNTGSSTTLITILDTLAPVVQTQNVTLYLNANGEATLNVMHVDNGTADNCAIDELSLSQTDFSCADQGLNTVQLTATDIYGNSASGLVEVTVVDTINQISGLVYSAGINIGTNDTVSVNNLNGASYQWSVTNGNVISQNQNEAIVSYSNGPLAQLKLIQTSTEGCIDSISRKVNVFPLAVQNLAGFDNRFNIYPNPSSDWLAIELERGELNDVQLKLYNHQGQLVTHRTQLTFSQGKVHTVDVSQLARGVYTLQIASGDNASAFRIIVQ